MNATTATAIRFAIDIALKATLLFSITALAIALLRRSGAAARHMAATAGLLGALALPLLALALPPLSLPVLPAVFSPAVAERPSSWSSLEKNVAPAAETERGVSEASPASNVPVPKSSAPSVPSRPAAMPVPWLLVGLAAWSLGAFLVATRLTVGLLRVRRIRREAAPLRDPEWMQETERLARQLEVRRPVELLESARVPIAMTSGLRRPLLLLCRQARFWTVERRRVVLLHELAHVRRADWLWLLLAEASLAIYWWHPLAWALARQVRRDCERACDDLVLTAGTKPSVYAGHLLGIFRSLSAAAHPVAPAVASERPSHFEGRLRAILDPSSPRRERPAGRAFVSAAGLLAAAAAIAVVQPWAPVCSGAAMLPYADGEWTAVRNGKAAPKTPAKTASTAACAKARRSPATATATAKVSPVVATAPRPGSQACPRPAEAPAPRAEEAPAVEP